MLILLLPITTFCVAVLGFYVWHRQLTRKRLFEVADAALSAFSRAEAALGHAQSAASFAHEVERLSQHSDAFDELERAAFAVEVHFGEEIAHQVREPLRAYNRIIMATTFRMGLVGMPGGVSDRLRQRLAAVHSGNGPRIVDHCRSEQLSDRITTAKADVENALRPWLVAPTFGEFLLARNWGSSTRRQVMKFVAWRRRSGGHGKLAIYAQLPPTSGHQLPDFCADGARR